MTRTGVYVIIISHVPRLSLPLVLTGRHEEKKTVMSPDVM